MVGQFVGGLLIGVLMTSVIFTVVTVLIFKYDGKIIVKYDENGEGPYFFLEIDEPRKIEKQYYIVLRVKRR